MVGQFLVSFLMWILEWGMIFETFNFWWKLNTVRMIIFERIKFNEIDKKFSLSIRVLHIDSPPKYHSARSKLRFLTTAITNWRMRWYYSNLKLFQTIMNIKISTKCFRLQKTEIFLEKCIEYCHTQDGNSRHHSYSFWWAMW